MRIAGTGMSQKRDVNSYPDGYRVLNTSELRELLQDEDKMNQIVRLSEKVRLGFTFLWIRLRFPSDQMLYLSFEQCDIGYFLKQENARM